MLAEFRGENLHGVVCLLSQVKATHRTKISGMKKNKKKIKMGAKAVEPKSVCLWENKHAALQQRRLLKCLSGAVMFGQVCISQSATPAPV